jgi:hypothetical protein
MAPTHDEVGLWLLIGPRRIQGLALEAYAYSAVPECGQVRIVGPALGVCCCHRRRQKNRQVGCCSGVDGNFGGCCGIGAGGDDPKKRDNLVDLQQTCGRQARQACRTNSQSADSVGRLVQQCPTAPKIFTAFHSL